MSDFRTGMSGGCMVVKYLKCGILPKHVFVDPQDGGGFVKYVPERTCNRVVKTNERPGKTVFNQWYACSECGSPMGSGENFCASCGAKVVE